MKRNYERQGLTGKVLIVDDNELNVEALCDIVSSMGHEVACAFTAEEGLRAAREHSFDVVFLDIKLPDGNGLLLLPSIHATPSAPEVIIITGFGSPDGAEIAIKNGAWDFVEKPVDRNLIGLPLVRALQYREAKKANCVPLVLTREGIVGSSPIMEACMGLVAQAAASHANVLITGETGTGKELFAHAIHSNSSRKDMPFVTVDCTSLPPTIIESILFGHEKGAFTGADRLQEGLIRQADGGTLFLDEVGDLPLSAQKSFLRVLQEHSYRPLGAKREVKSDFRLIAATNRDLNRMVQEDKFRGDLLFRLNTFCIELPQLRKRPPGDIKELAFYYVNKIFSRLTSDIKGFSPEFIDALCAYDWPGNVRELVNTLERALAVALHEPILYPQHLPAHIRIRLARKAIHYQEDNTVCSMTMCTLKERRESVLVREERQYLQDLMDMTGGNIKQAYEIAGISLPRMYQLIKKYKIKVSH